MSQLPLGCLHPSVGHILGHQQHRQQHSRWPSDQSRQQSNIQAALVACAVAAGGFCNVNGSRSRLIATAIRIQVVRFFILMHFRCAPMSSELWRKFDLCEALYGD